MRLLVRLVMGPIKPRHQILGQEFAGEVQAVGEQVTRFRVGDLVYGTTGFGFGAYAEYICLRPSSRDVAIASKPANMSFEEAATIPTGGLEALHFLRKAGSIQGRKVAIVGAGGGIGAIAIQLAKSWGADVTAVETTRKIGLVLELGADRAIDFTQEEFTKTPETYDVILDVVGRSQFSACLRALRPNGYYLLANPGLVDMMRGPLSSMIAGKKVVVRGSAPRSEDLDYLRGLIEELKLRAVVDTRYRLEDVVEAHQRVDSGLNIGRVVMSV